MKTTELLSFAAVAKSIPGGKCSPSSCYRWAYRGLKTVDGRTVKLRVIKVGKCFMTSREYLEEFLREASGVHGQGMDAGMPPPSDGAAVCAPGACGYHHNTPALS